MIQKLIAIIIALTIGATTAESIGTEVVKDAEVVVQEWNKAQQERLDLYESILPVNGTIYEKYN